MPAAPYRFLEAELHPAQRVLRVGGQDCQVGARAFDLLLALVERARARGLQERAARRRVAGRGGRGEQPAGADQQPAQAARRRRPSRPCPGAAIASWRRCTTRPPRRAGGRRGPAPLSRRGRSARRRPTCRRAAGAVRARATTSALLAGAARAHRLVTVVGAGGIGKTPARAGGGAPARSSRCADGVWWIELAALADAGAAAARGGAGARPRHRRARGRRCRRLVAALAPRPMLLVLDNCEHLLEPRRRVRRRDAAGARPAARAGHEPGAAAPAGRAAVPARAARPCPRRRTRRRARAATAPWRCSRRACARPRPRFELADGGPAARRRHLPAARRPAAGDRAGRGARAAARPARASARGCDERFLLLTGGARIALRRHQTLRAALDWSHALLSDERAGRVPPPRRLRRRLHAGAGAGGARRRRPSTTGRCSSSSARWSTSRWWWPRRGEPPRYRLLEIGARVRARAARGRRRDRRRCSSAMRARDAAVPARRR